MLDSILINTPVSSPLHIQANLPILKGYLTGQGYKTKVIDSNIKFFHWFLGESISMLSMEEIYRDPLKALEMFTDFEKKLYSESQKYDGLSVGLRYLHMKYDRIHFDGVLKAIQDEKANPFIEFYNGLVFDHIYESGAKIIAIAITFQDQIISAFTLARILRRVMPDVKIVMGGQMITRCSDEMIKNPELCKFFDYLVLWDGEKCLADIHRKEIRGEEVAFVNTIDMLNPEGSKIDRKSNAPLSVEIAATDYSDVNFDDYFLPEYLVPLQTTRGCYAKCEFCAIPFGANAYRVRPVDRIIHEILRIQDETLKKNGKKAILFKFMEDTSSPKLLFELSVEIEKRGIEVYWETFARLEKAFSKDGVLEQLYRGGCRKVHWGLESNDPDVLKGMNKKTEMSYCTRVLEMSAKAGILNFCFILVGFPGESAAAREGMTRYIIENKNIHTITITTFDLSKGSPMEQNFKPENPYKLDMRPARDFEVRLPYLVDGKNWKAEIIPYAHQMMLSIIRERPDIGFMTLFPDQLRSLFCQQYTNRWGTIFVEKYGKENIKSILLNTEKYVMAYQNNQSIDPDLLPEPLRREHYRTKEDMKMIAEAMLSRKGYEERRMDQV